MQLPPKRFQEYYDTKFDSIRHQPWFASLETRREKIDVLRLAEFEDMPLTEAAKLWKVDVRELRDYCDFINGRSKFKELSIFDQRTYQYLLDHAYDVYVDIGASRPISKIIYDESRLFGVNARHVVELWEIDPAFYPGHYRGIK